MGITCKKCNKGTMVFYDGGLEHEPKWICNNCEFEKGDETNKMKDIKEMSNEKLLEQHDLLYDDLVKEIGDRKDNLLLLLEIERELTIREEQP